MMDSKGLNMRHLRGISPINIRAIDRGMERVTSAFGYSSPLKMIDSIFDSLDRTVKEAVNPKLGEVYVVREMVPTETYYRWDQEANGDITRHKLTPEEVSIHKANQAVTEGESEA